MNYHIRLLVVGLFTSISAVLSANVSAVEFTYDASFTDISGMSNVEFPVELSNAQPGDISEYRIYSVSGTTQTDVTTLGCGVASSTNVKSSFIASSAGTAAMFSATCPSSSVAPGSQARLVLTVNQTQPLVMAAGPSVVGVNDSTKISWSHNGGYFQCQPFTINGSNMVWSSGNFSLVNQVTSSNQGSMTLVASSSPGTASFALQCISSFGGGIPPVAAVDVVVQ